MSLHPGCGVCAWHRAARSPCRLRYSPKLYSGTLCYSGTLFPLCPPNKARIPRYRSAQFSTVIRYSPAYRSRHHFFNATLVRQPTHYRFLYSLARKCGRGGGFFDLAARAMTPPYHRREPDPAEHSPTGTMHWAFIPPARLAVCLIQSTSPRLLNPRKIALDPMSVCRRSNRRTQRTP
jgi:hypothetical protein